MQLEIFIFYFGYCNPEMAQYNPAMSDPEAAFENIWEDLLSRVPQRTWQAFSALDSDQQQVVVFHLKRMVEEQGWHPEQRRSALAALEAITNFRDRD